MFSVSYSSEVIDRKVLLMVRQAFGKLDLLCMCVYIYTYIYAYTYIQTLKNKNVSIKVSTKAFTQVSH